MTYRIPLPVGLTLSELDVIDPFETMIQRFLRREGLGAYEPETMAAVLALVEMADQPCVLDVGANIGLYSSLSAALRPDAGVTAFEPMPRIAEIAGEIAEANGLSVEVVNGAVGDTTGVATLYLSDVSDASNSLVSGFKPSSATIDVPVSRLDDVVDGRGIVPTLLKIDVETAESAVLRGAIETIRRHRPFIVIEVLRRRGVDHGAAIEEALGVSGYHRYPLTREPDWTSRDAVAGSGTAERDWLLAPRELPADFHDRWRRWFDRLEACGPERNSRAPIWPAIRLAHRRGGVTELWRTCRRVVRRSSATEPTGARTGSGGLRRLVERGTDAVMFRHPSNTLDWAYSSRRPGGVRDRAAERLLRTVTVSADRRAATVTALEGEFFRLCDARRVDLLVEIGAKDARASQRAVSEFDIDAIAFEANPFTFRRFVDDVRGAGVDYRNQAVVDREGSVTFHVRLTEDGRPRADGQGSTLVRSEYAPGHQEVEVDGTRLDDVSDLVDGTRDRLALWIDVEGATAAVLRGASAVLARVDVVFVEVETDARWDGQELLAADVVGELAAHGLRPVGRDLQARRQFNVLFARG